MESKSKLIQYAIILSILTISYNLIEGIVSVYFGASDETLALFGFGLDSFVELISGIGIFYMVARVKANNGEWVNRYEKNALLITGVAFYLLTIGLFSVSIYNLINIKSPITTISGIIISLLSIATMWWLMKQKHAVGYKLNSDAIISDAKCTKVCLQLSFVLLFASLGYELFSISGIDSIGALIISGLSFKEGREAFDKANGKKDCC